MSDCSRCEKYVFQNRSEPVPFTAHELDMARLERSNKRGFILNILLVLALVASWVGFIVYESQFETVTETVQKVEQEAEDGGSNVSRIIGGDLYGTTDDYYND